MVKDRIKKLLNLDTLFQNVEGLIETRIQLFKIEMQEQISQQIKKAILASIGILFGLLCLIILSITLALWIGSITNSLLAGFLIVGGLCFLGALTVFLIYQSKYKKATTPVVPETEEPTTHEGESEPDEAFERPE